MHAFVKHILSLGALLFMGGVATAQDTLEQRATSSPVGGKWMSSGTITQFSSAGQMAAQSGLSSADGTWTGTVGFVGPTFSLEPNEPPVAVSLEEEVFYELGQTLILEGFDPEDDPIAFEIVSQPALGTLALVEGTDNEYSFLPGSDLQPDTDYSDVLEFRVKETSGAQKVSDVAQVRFKFRVEDEAHLISDLTFDNSNGALALSWTDAVQNAAYGVELSYYDLTNVQSPVFRTLFSDQVPVGNLTITDGTVAFNQTVDSEAHPYVFAGAKVFVTALVTTENGNSDFVSFVVDNSGGSRTAASEDGLFFAFGSNMTVIENKSVNLRLMAVELGDFNLSETSLEVIQVASQGSLGAATVSETTENTKTWVMSFTGTQEVGGIDSVQFRVFHPERQVFDTAWAKIEIKDVNDPPKVTRVADQQTVEETPFTIDLNFTDPDNEVEVFVESNNAGRVAAVYDNGVITVTPGQDFSGQVSVNVVITEQGTDEEYVAFDRFDVEVEAVNDPPVVATISDQSILEDNTLTLSVSASDVDSKTQLFDYFVDVSEPSLFKVGVNGNTIKLVPNANVNGTFTVNVFADDRQATATSRSIAESFTLTIEAVNDAPMVVKSFTSQKIVQGLPDYSLNMGAYFTDVENGSALTYTASGNDKINLTFDGANMMVSPADDFSGVEDVNIVASDGELSVEQAITFVSVAKSANIDVANDPGTISVNEDFGTEIVDMSSVFEDVNNAGAVFTYNVIGGNFLNVSIDTLSGELTFSAPENYNGSESLFLVGTTGGQSAFVNFSIDVAAVNDAPVLSSIANQVTQEDLGLSGLFVELSDIDNDFGDLSLNIESTNEALIPAANITVAAVSGGYTLGINPAANAFGLGEIKLTATDGIDQTSVSFNVNVQSVNDKPEVAVNEINPATEDQSYFLDVTALFTDIEGDELTYEATELPEWASFTADAVSGTPTNDDVETWVVTVKANDGNGGTTTASYQLPVSNVNDAPELINALGEITAFQEDEWVFNFPVSNFRDVDAGEELTYTFKEYPSWASVSGSSLSGTPGYEDIGTYNLVLEVQDAAGATVTDETTVTVAFTIYDVNVTVSVSEGCSDGQKTATASGAHTYNWYDDGGNLIGQNQAELTLEPGSYEVIGVDSQGRTAPARVGFSIEKCVVLDVEQPEMAIYPNPTSDWLYLQNVPVDANLMLFDALGRAHRLKLENDQEGYRADLTELPSGMYFIKTNQSSKIWKVIKKE